MHTIKIGIFLTALAGTALQAEPARPEAAPPAIAARQTPEVVLAAADQGRAPQLAQPAEAMPAKRRVARVTTCRCGDPQAEADQQEQ